MADVIPDEILDLKGVPCPKNSALTMVKLETMDKGEILEVIIDDGEPKENVPASIEQDENYKIINMQKDNENHWHLLVKVL